MDFSDLPRSKLRALTKCPNCNKYNGNKAKKCKNKFCVGIDLAKSNTVKACRITTGFSTPEYFSVRIRDKAADFRIFVELSKISSDSVLPQDNVMVVSAKCNANGCLQASKKQKESSAVNVGCSHIQAAANCSSVALILEIKTSVLDMLCATNRMKEDIVKMTSDNSSLVVQRVSKNVFVVKTKIMPKHPYGFLHISFNLPRIIPDSYSCKCDYNAAKLLKSYNSLEGSTNILKYCIHFYLCVCAFVSNTKLLEEFRQYVSLVVPNIDSVYNLPQENQNSSSDADLKDMQCLQSSDDVNNTVNALEDIQCLQFPGDLTVQNELFPLVTQMIECSNGKMIQIHTEMSPSEILAENNKKGSDVQTNDVVVYEMNNDGSQTVEACDILMTDSNRENIINSQNFELLDVSQNYNLINLSDVVVDDVDAINLDCQTNESNNNVIKVKNDVIDFKNVILEKEIKLNENVYTISGDDSSLKIISIEQCDSFFPKVENYSFLSTECNNSSNYSFNDILIENMVDDLNEGTSICGETSNGQNQIDLFNAVSLPVSESNLLSSNANLCESKLQNEIKPKKRKKNMSLDYKNDTVNNFSGTVCQNYVPMINNGIAISQNNQSSITNDPNLVKPTLLGTKCIVTTNRQENELLCRNLLRKKRTIKEAERNLSEEKKQSDDNLSFIEWLSSVTEKINQSMHFQFDGKTETLVFHIPEKFFECFHDRMSLKNELKRLPNKMSVFDRKKGVPLGRFTMYTWYIFSLDFLKRIFDTPEITLESTQVFKQNQDGTYTHVERAKKMCINSAKSKDRSQIGKDKLNLQKIVSGNLATFIKVGNTPENNETPFCIEWIPNILPRTKVGELRLKYEFGHLSNYVV